MVQFHVPDMTCGACANRIGKALQQAALPSGLQVEIDVAARQVRLGEAASAPIQGKVRSAIEAAGYTAAPMPDERASSSLPGAGGCCCASRRTPRVDASQRAVSASAGCCG